MQCVLVTTLAEASSTASGRIHNPLLSNFDRTVLVCTVYAETLSQVPALLLRKAWDGKYWWRKPGPKFTAVLLSPTKGTADLDGTNC